MNILMSTESANRIGVNRGEATSPGHTLLPSLHPQVGGQHRAAVQEDGDNRVTSGETGDTAGAPAGQALRGVTITCAPFH